MVDATRSHMEAICFLSLSYTSFYAEHLKIWLIEAFRSPVGFTKKDILS